MAAINRMAATTVLFHWIVGTFQYMTSSLSARRSIEMLTGRRAFQGKRPLQPLIAPTQPLSSYLFFMERPSQRSALHRNFVALSNSWGILSLCPQINSFPDGLHRRSRLFRINRLWQELLNGFSYTVDLSFTQRLDTAMSELFT